jgi:amphiphysin
LVVEIAVQVQFTLLQHSYSAMYHYANEYGFTDPDGDVVVSEWEELFLPIKQQVETELKFIAKGKAVTMPMNVIQDKSILPKLPSMPSNPLARGKKPPPPPPPATANNALPSPPRGRENTRPSIGHHKSSASISSASVSSRFSRNEDTSPVSPIPSARPSIGRIRASNQSMERDESPPPPLPGPRPSNGVSKDDRPRIGPYGSSYGGGGGSAVTPTPLAGLRPSELTGSNS